ncbi:hypothetical protein HPB49_017471 [Dermacentor silvarum]|uniref:Uncharacterized protein n=1 Tax=Dermacentor silvarum TaxID=543639 RepID=A0ACB8E1U4_DERSI|nr:hypothetical protein HPB49_017471 [Dermacentor silvarum]
MAEPEVLTALRQQLQQHQQELHTQQQQRSRNASTTKAVPAGSAEDRALTRNMQVQDSFLRALWLQRLLPHVQAILQAQVRLPLNELAEIDDLLIEASMPQLSPTIQAGAAPLNTTELARHIDDIDQQLASIQQHPAPPLAKPRP